MTEPAQTSAAEQITTVVEFLEDKRPAIDAVLSQGIDLDQWLGVAKATIGGNTKLRKCVPMTLYTCLRDAAHLGLSVDPRVGEFYLIPRKNKHLSRGGPDVFECTPMVGYKGFTTMGRRAGVVTRVKSAVVYADEAAQGVVEIDQAQGIVRHPFKWSGINRTDDQIVGAYCVLWLPGDEMPIVEPLTREQIDKRRAKAQKDEIWREWFVEMCRKTVIRYAFSRGNVSLTGVVGQPKKPADVDVEAPPALTLGDAMRIDEAGERAAELDAPSRVTVTVPEQPETELEIVEEDDGSGEKKKGKKKKPADDPQVEYGVRLAAALTDLVGTYGDDLPEVEDWFRRTCEQVFGSTWEFFDEARCAEVLLAFDSGWGIEDLDLDGDQLGDRLEGVRGEVKWNQVDVVDCAERNELPYDGTQESLKAMAPEDMRRLIQLVRRKK